MTHGRAACHHIARQSWWFGKSGTLLYFSYHVNVWDANEVIIIMITKEMVYLLWIFTGMRKSRGHFLKCKHKIFLIPSCWRYYFCWVLWQQIVTAQNRCSSSLPYLLAAMFMAVQVMRGGGLACDDWTIHILVFFLVITIWIIIYITDSFQKNCNWG